MNERNYYVICDDNCRFEGMTKEQIYEAIAEATGTTPTPVDEAFITKIKEQNAQHSLKVWKGTEAQYNALSTKDADTLYIIGTNEVKPIDMDAIMAEVDNEVETKYAEITAITEVCTLDSDGWTAEGDFYKQSVEVNSIYDTHPVWTPCSSDGTGVATSLDAMFLIYVVSGSNSLTFYAYNEPSVDLYVLVKGVD